MGSDAGTVAGEEASDAAAAVAVAAAAAAAVTRARAPVALACWRSPEAGGGRRDG